jgi:hypothetical protein
MSELERLRELAAQYSRLAGLVSKQDGRNWLLGLAADALRQAQALERQVSDSAVQHPARQQQQQQQPQSKDDDPKKE